MVKEVQDIHHTREDLRIAREVQGTLIPAEFPMKKYYDISGSSLAAEEAGGDFYDFQKLPDSKLALIIADISGKGISAAFHVAQLKGIFQTLTIDAISPAEFMRKANLSVRRCFKKSLFATSTYLELDPSQQIFSYCRAGHCPTLFYEAETDQVHTLSGEGLGLGIADNKIFTSNIDDGEIAFHKSDVIVMFTDGVSEARDPATGEEFGFERLASCLHRSKQLTSQKIMKYISAEVDQFVKSTKAVDDLTIMVIKAL